MTLTKKIVFSIVFTLLVFSSYSQETTTGEAVDAVLVAKNNVLIVPFETKMYFSDIDKDLSQNSDLNFHEIKAKFRAELDRNLFISLKEFYNPLSFYSIEQSEAIKELSYIYNSIGYKYEIIQPEVVEKENAAKKLFNKVKKKEAEPEEAKIQNGEIISQVDNREKYMKTTITNEKLIPTLNNQHQAKYYVFINQLDIKRSADDAYKAAEHQYKREIKVHYTVLDNDGKEVTSGAIISRFNSGENDINKIIKIHFPLITEKIVANILGPLPEQAIVK